MTTPPPSLKPCPFCGAQPVTQDYRSSSDETGEVYGYAAVECHHGKADGGAVFHCDTLEEAITAWNTRASDTLEADVAALLEALDKYADDLCEGWCEKSPDCAHFDDCAGCLARRTTLERTAR